SPTHSYDAGAASANPIGRRTGMADAAGSESWTYDPVGRALTDQRTTNGVTKTTAYAYNFDGSLASLTYPSGRVVNYAYTAAARALSAIDPTGPINYATSASYTPGGAPSALTNGASITSSLFYNPRLEPCRISVKASDTA